MFNFIPFEGSDGIEYSSYLTVVDLDEITTKDPFIPSLPSTITNEEKENGLISSTNFIDSNFIFKGNKFSDLQSKEFPRDFEDGLIINEDIKKAASYVCSMILNGKMEDLFYNESSEVKSEKYDALSVSFVENKNKDTLSLHPYLKSLLGIYTLNRSIQVFNLER